MSKKTKLKKIELTSVDMVRRGANQEAYINLYKSAGDPAEPNAPSDTTDAQVAPNSDENLQSLWKTIADAVKGFLKTSAPQEAPQEGTTEEVGKAAETFQEKREAQEIRDDRWKFQDALNMSIDSILGDEDLTKDQKTKMIAESILQFSDAYMETCEKLLNTTVNKATNSQPEGEPQAEEPEIKESEGDTEMKIDKSRFTPEELMQYEALLAKGKVEDDEPTKDEPTEKPDIEKAAEMHPEVKKALEDMEALKKSMEMNEMANIAKKYVPLGKKEDELAQTLYNMKKSSEASYEAYIAVLDQNLDLVNKSGMFEEIGKSSRTVAGGSTLDKIEGIATELQKSDATLGRTQAIAKAWEQHPELVAEYDAEYQK